MGGVVDAIFGGGGSSGGGSQPAPTSQNQTVSNIAPWAQPGVANLINAASGQIFTDANQTQLKGYTPFNANTPAGQEWVQGAAGSVAGFSPLQQQAQQNIANMQVPGQYGTAMNAAQQAGQGYLDTTGQAANYGAMGSGYGSSAAGLAPQAQLYGQNAAGIGIAGGLGYGAQGAQAGQTGAGYGAIGAQQGASYGQNATNPNAVQAYMNPYLQATLNPALQLQNQQFGQLNAQNQGQATQQGAFGGGRQAVMQGLNQQNQMLAQNQLVGNAYNQAYNTANQNMQQAAALGMQGAGLGIQGQNAAMQGAGIGLQGVNAAMQGQQTGLQGLQQAGSLYGQGMQGAQIGLQGVGAQQAGYGGAGSQATNLANIAGAQTQTGLNINAAQNQAGALQQQNQQNILNQAMANYNTAQTYPMTQLAQLESLYTGAPQNITSSTYSAAPSTVSQLANLGAGAYAASKLAAKGGLMKTKKMAAGGIASFDVGGAVGKVDYSLENMDAEQLEDTIRTSTSPYIRQKAKELLPMAMQRSAGVTGAGSGKGFAAGGGIVAFANGGSAFTDEEMYAGSNRQTPLPPIATQSPVSGGLKNVMSYLDQLKSMGYGTSSEEGKALREEIKQERAELKAGKEKNFYRALLQGAGEGLQVTSPFANPGIGKLISGTSQAYAAGEKDYADQLAKLRSGELDLSKMDATDRNNLLHYAMTGATSESNTEMRTRELLEAAKLRASQVGAANADRQFNAKVSAYNNAYGKLLQARKDVLGVNPLTAQDYADIENQAAHAAERFIQGASAKGKDDKGSKGPKVGAENAPSNVVDFNDFNKPKG